MTTTSTFLKDLEFYCKNERALEKKKEATRLIDNFNRIQKRLNQNIKISQSNPANFKKIKSSIDNISIAHYTNLTSLIGIIEDGAVFCTSKLLDNHALFMYRSSIYGFSDIQQEHVFATIKSGEWLYGMYEISFSKTVENLPNAKFLPKGIINYYPVLLNDYLMDIKYWRDYLTKYISLNYDSFEDYMNSTPVHLRPEFLFYKEIPISYVEEITCATEKDYYDLIKIVKERPIDRKILNCIKVFKK